MKRREAIKASLMTIAGVTLAPSVMAQENFDSPRHGVHMKAYGIPDMALVEMALGVPMRLVDYSGETIPEGAQYRGTRYMPVANQLVSMVIMFEHPSFELVTDYMVMEVVPLAVERL